MVDQRRALTTYVPAILSCHPRFSLSQPIQRKPRYNGGIAIPTTPKANLAITSLRKLLPSRRARPSSSTIARLKSLLPGVCPVQHVRSQKYSAGVNNVRIPSIKAKSSNRLFILPRIANCATKVKLAARSTDRIPRSIANAQSLSQRPIRSSTDSRPCSSDGAFN